MFQTKPKKIESQKNKAFSVFIKVRDELLHTAAKAMEYHQKNTLKVRELQIENEELTTQIDSITRSLHEIESIIK